MAAAGRSNSGENAGENVTGAIGVGQVLLKSSLARSSALEIVLGTFVRGPGSMRHVAFDVHSIAPGSAMSVGRCASMPAPALVSRVSCAWMSAWSAFVPGEVLVLVIDVVGCAPTASMTTGVAWLVHDDVYDQEHETRGPSGRSPDGRWRRRESNLNRADPETSTSTRPCDLWVRNCWGSSRRASPRQSTRINASALRLGNIWAMGVRAMRLSSSSGG